MPPSRSFMIGYTKRFDKELGVVSFSVNSLYSSVRVLNNNNPSSDPINSW